MDLLKFARDVKTGSHLSPRKYVELMNLVVPLEELRNLTPEEAEWFHAAIAWLYDLSILVFEFAQAEQGKRPELAGAPWLPGPSGPFIPTMLTRAPGEPPDFSFLKTFGVKENPEDQS